MKKTLGLGIAALMLTALLPGCVLQTDGMIVDVPSRHSTVVASTSTTVYDHGYGDSYGDGSWYDDGYGDHGGYHSHDTTVITQTTPVIVDRSPVVVPAAQPEAVGIDPVIQAFTANPSNIVAQGQPITFTVVANDPNHDALQFNWSSTAGTLSTNTGRVVTWEPPTTPGTYTVSTIITNGRGGAVTGSQNLTVLADGRVNTAATAQAVPAAAQAPAAAPAQPVVQAPPHVATTPVVQTSTTTQTTTTQAQWSH